MSHNKCDHDKRKDRCKNCKKIDLVSNESDFTINTINKDYHKMKYEELLFLCRERKIKGISKLIYKKENMIKLLEENLIRKSLYDYIIENNPDILTKFIGNHNDLKFVSPGTNNYYVWKCDTTECSNTFEAIPRNVYNTESPRKFCDNCTQINRVINYQKVILKKSGSIKEKYLFIEEIWSNENSKTPNEISYGSNERVKLKCPNKSAKHPDYDITINKINENNCYRCPKCVTKTSKAEMRIYSELKYSFNDVKWQHKIENREADVIIEDLKLVIEIDGFPWHKNKSDKDLLKNSIFEKNGYTILRIRDPRLEEISCNNIKSDLLELSLIDYNKIIEWINIKFKLNKIKYNEWKNPEFYKEIQSSKICVKYEESIEYLFPESKKLWDYEKNYPLTPSQFSKGSDMQIWIKCNNGHSWKRKLSHLFRTIKNKNHIMKCPHCNIPNSNNKMIEINGKLYNSISECCRELNINRNHIYKRKNIDVKKEIEKILNKIN